MLVVLDFLEDFFLGFVVGVLGLGKGELGEAGLEVGVVTDFSFAPVSPG